MRRASVGFAALLAALALGACGSESKVPTTTQPASDAAAPPAGAPQGAPQLSDDQRQAFEEFQQCLRDNGAQAPTSPPSGGAAPQLDDATRKALEACRDKLPAGAPPGMPPAGATPPSGTAG